MQNKQQKPSHESLPQPRKQTTVLHEVELARSFSNPICKETYNSLPKIYGKKKKKAKLITMSEKDVSKNVEHSRVKSRSYFSSNDNHSTSQMQKIKKNTERATQLSEPKHPSNCQKKNCYCHKELDEINGQKHANKVGSSKLRKIILPEIRKFQLEDLESKHKVIQQDQLSKTAYPGSGLQSIINQSEVVKNNTIAQQSNQRHSFNDLKNKYRVKARFNNTRFQIQEQSDQQNKTDQNYQQGESKRTKKSRKEFRTEAINSEPSPKSANSISLTSYILRTTKRQNTKFHDLSLNEKHLENSRLKRVPSQLSNGLFRIPEQSQYHQYLTNYKNLCPAFSIKSLIKEPKFKIVKGEKQVYFGQIDELQRKHGKGITISEKQIYEGQYEKGYRQYGYQRNIDGVYIGGYQNGLRSGQGVFKWNNGEIFQGNWKLGTKNGFGTWKSPKGDSYEGNWYQNRQHGQGIFKHRISTYQGQFKNFLKDGKGSQKFSNGDKYEGQYKEGKPNGRGKYEWSEGGFYEGEFLKGMREGRGKWVDANGTIYEVQAILSKISSMALAGKCMHRAKSTRVNFMREIEQKAKCMIKTQFALKLQGNDYITIFFYLISQLYLV